MRSVIQEINMASKPIKDPTTQVASRDVPGAKLEVDVPRAKLDIDYMTNKVVLTSTDLNEHRRLLG